MTKAKFQGYLLRSKINPASLLCTNGKYHAEMWVGASAMQNLSAKIYKTLAGANKAADRYVATVEPYIN